MPYFIYCRKSQEDAKRQVQSIGDQLKSCRDTAAQCGAAVIAEFEEAMSAKRPGRPVLEEMLRRVEAGEADGIIAWHPDRLARNAMDAGRIIDLIDRGKLRDLKFQSYRFENTPEGKWMLGIVLGQSKYFVDKLATDVKRGLHSKVDKGHMPAKALAGYMNDTAAKTIIADPERFPLVRRAIELILSGDATAAQALDILNHSWGFRTRRTDKTGGGLLSSTAFYHMLSSPFLMGMLCYRGEVSPGSQPALLSADEFERMRGILGARRAKPRRRQHKFRGMIRGMACGCLATPDRRVKSYPRTGRTVEYVYYHCTNGRGGCGKGGIREEVVVEAISDVLCRLHVPPELEAWCREEETPWTPDTASEGEVTSLRQPSAAGVTSLTPGSTARRHSVTQSSARKRRGWRGKYQGFG